MIIKETDYNDIWAYVYFKLHKRSSGVNINFYNDNEII